MLSAKIQKNTDLLAGFFLFSMFPVGMYLACIQVMNYSLFAPLAGLWLASSVNVSIKKLPIVLLANWAAFSFISPVGELTLLATVGVLFMWTLQKIIKEISY